MILMRLKFKKLEMVFVKRDLKIYIFTHLTIVK